MTLEQEKRFVLLAAIVSLGGVGTKGRVLDHIESHQWLKLSGNDLQEKHNRNELVWRNDLAYVRKHLVQESHVSGQNHNSWQVTPRGREYFLQLCNIINGSSSFHKLAAQGVTHARAMSGPTSGSSHRP